MASDKQSSPAQYPHSPTALAIDFSKLPCYLCDHFRPYKRDVFRVPVLETIQTHAASVHRPLTPDETTALAYYEAKCRAISEWAIPLGMGSLATHFLDHGRKALKKPLRVATSALLPTACIFLCSEFVPAWGVARDPRLTDFNADLRATLRGKSFGELWKQYKEIMETRMAKSDGKRTLPDIDRTNDAGDKRMVGGADVGELKRGAHVNFQDTRQQPVPRSSPQSNRTAAEDHSSSSSTESDWSQDPSDGGSAWERIRRRAGLSASGKNEHWGTTDGRGTGKQRESSENSGGDDFSFSSSEQERSYAQEEAQRDFDARVEKERQGGDFSEESGGGGG